MLSRPENSNNTSPSLDLQNGVNSRSSAQYHRRSRKSISANDNASQSSSGGPGHKKQNRGFDSNDRWDHSGYYELMEKEEKEQARKLRRMSRGNRQQQQQQSLTGGSGYNGVSWDGTSRVSKQQKRSQTGHQTQQEESTVSEKSRGLPAQERQERGRRTTGRKAASSKPRFHWGQVERIINKSDTVSSTSNAGGGCGEADVLESTLVAGISHLQIGSSSAGQDPPCEEVKVEVESSEEENDSSDDDDDESIIILDVDDSDANENETFPIAFNPNTRRSTASKTSPETLFLQHQHHSHFLTGVAMGTGIQESMTPYALLPNTTSSSVYGIANIYEDLRMTNQELRETSVFKPARRSGTTVKVEIRDPEEEQE